MFVGGRDGEFCTQKGQNSVQFWPFYNFGLSECNRLRLISGCIS